MIPDERDYPEVEDWGPCCARCVDFDVPLFTALCAEKPETQTALGMYHCPDCGSMVMGGLPHPDLCEPCNTRARVGYDLPFPAKIQPT